MTLHEVAELMAYWEVNPPAYILLAALLGFSGNARKSASAAIPQQTLGELGPGFYTGDVHAGLGTAVIDIARLRQRSQSTKI
ncbi:MAG: hypothetical protein ACREE4_13715 [Stellaceae bacterium]